MLIKQVIKNFSPELILFFNGWSMDEEVISHLSSKNYDVITVYDYTNLDNVDELRTILKSYSKYSVIAWSLGVWCFSEIAELLPKPNLAVAINGTLSPIDEFSGISPSVYQATIDNLSEITKKKFDRRMFTALDEYNQFLSGRPKRTIESQKLELISIKQRYINSNEAYNPYNAVIISNNDKIFTTQNQINYWKSIISPILIESGHFPYYNYTNWEEILDMADENV